MRRAFRSWRRCGLLAAAAALGAPEAVDGYARWMMPNGYIWRADYAGVLFRVDPSVVGGLTNSEGGLLITAESDPQAALAAAMNTWNAVPATTARFESLLVTAGKPGSGDGLNAFTFDDTPQARSFVGSAIAVTRVMTRNGAVLDTDIYFNPGYTFSTTRYAGSMDIQEIATHELGHALGAQHSNLVTSTMYPFASPEETFRRTLSDDDIAFVSSTYPLPGTSMPYGTIAGTVTFDNGSPVRGAAVVAVEADRGTVVSAMTEVLDGKYKMTGVPPGRYYLHAEPIGSMLAPSNLGLSESQTDLHWNAVVYGGAATPAIVEAGSGGTANADLVVSSTAATPFEFDFLSVSELSGWSVDFGVVHSGQAVDVMIFGTGFNDSMRAEDVLILGQAGVTIRPGTFEVWPGDTASDEGMVYFAADVQARSDWAMVLFGIRRGGDAIFTDTLRVAPAGPAFLASAAANGAGAWQDGLAPGEIASLFGSGLGPEDGVAGAVTGGRLPRSLSGVSLTLDELEAPLFYASNGQVNFLVPNEVAGRASIRLKVTVNGTAGEAVTVPVVDSAPGVFPFGWNWAVINQDWTVNSVEEPAAVGSVVMVYCTGLGAVAPAVETGAVTPDAPLSVAQGVTAKVNGQDAPVWFAGLAPGFVGLMQVNVQIPTGTAPDAAVPLEITSLGRSSQSWVTIAVGDGAPRRR